MMPYTGGRRIVYILLRIRFPPGWKVRPHTNEGKMEHSYILQVPVLLCRKHGRMIFLNREINIEENS